MPFMLFLNAYKENDFFFDIQLIRTLIGEDTKITDLFAIIAIIVLSISVLPRLFATLALIREFWFK